MPLNGNQFGTRVPVQFISDDKPSLSITTTQNVLANNPSALKVITGTNAKADPDLMGIPHFRGDGEIPPMLQIEWKELGYNDYLNLAALRPYLVTFITFRNKGYYGKLVMDGPESVMSSADIVHATGTFYTLAPSDDGGATSVARIPDPSGNLTVSGDGGAGSGGIAAGNDQYYYLTFSSEYGETNIDGPHHYHNSADKVAISLSWTWPSSQHLQKATIYNCSDSSGSNPMLVAEIPSALSATWTDFVGYSGLTVSQVMPTASTAYNGIWQNAIWHNAT